MKLYGLKRLTAILLIAAITAPALTQASVLEEVVVTAQKREQNLQDVGVSVTAFSGDQIKELGFTNSIDVIAQTPGLSYGTPTAEGNNASLTLRGVGLSDFNDNNEGPVAVYIDDVYVSALSGVTFQLFDLERVEVLRGPQGTLYGRNTTGGLVHFVTRKPADENGGYVDITAGEHEELKGEAVINGAFSDSVQGRISYAHNEHAGYVKNRGPGKQDPNNTDNNAARLQLAVQPSEDINLLFNVHGSKNDAHMGAWQHESTYSPDGGVTSLHLPADVDYYGTCPGCDAFGYRDDDHDPWAGAYDRDGALVIKNSGGSVHIEWARQNVTLTSITAYENFKRLFEEDTDASPYKIVHNTYTADIDQFTQEIRLAGTGPKFNWLTGVYYYDQKTDGGFRIDASGIGYIIGDANYDQKTKSWSLFGHAEYGLSDRVTVLGGLRYTKERRNIDYLSVDLGGLLPPDNNTMFAYRHILNTDNVTGKAELDWRPADNRLFYASVSLGAKSAGFNTGMLDETGLFGMTVRSDVPYKQEKLTSYEVGIKNELFGGTTRLNASAFHYDYNDFQAFAFVNLNQVIFNTDATIDGMEAELTTSPVEGLDILLGAAYLDAKAKDIPLNDGSGITRNRKMTLAPDFALNGMLRYQWPVASGHVAAQVDFNYQTETYFDIQDHPISRQGAYSVWNTRLSYLGRDGKWSVTAFVDNVFEKKYRVYTFDVTNLFGFNQVAYGRPRWAGISFRYNY